MDERFEERTEDQIDLGLIFKILFRKLPVILAVTLACGLAAFVYGGWFMRPVYSTNVKLYVNNQQGISESIKVQGTDVTTSSTLADVYGAMIKTDHVLEEVALNTGLGYTANQLSSMISASGVDGTPILVVTVRSAVPEHAQAIANVIADIAPALIQDVAKGSSAEIVDRAKLPRIPVSPKMGHIVLIGLALGVLLSAAGVLLQEKFDLRVKKTSQLSERFELPLLGTVTGDSGLDELKNNVKFSFPQLNCRTVALAGVAGGEDAGAVAAGLAVKLAGDGRRVMLVDADLGAPMAGVSLGQGEGLGLSDVLVGDASPEAAVRTGVRKNLDVLPAGTVPPDPVELMSCDGMKSLMEGFAGKYEYIVMAAPPVTGEDVGRLLAGLTDGVAVTVRLRRTTVDRIGAALDTLRRNGVRTVGFICTVKEGGNSK